ncbi:peptidoglycan-binding domain-containing protein [Indioceanicola profundi]|uniref:peptidoglycan-binding domain-containing protein n=1 Tax=Indioceanicola profundi TaxID=2220096 RepID=UPI0013C4A725|nr:peptidoglycan-binding domain-containing protein [Indioceanicola profundi]
MKSKLLVTTIAAAALFAGGAMAQQGGTSTDSGSMGTTGTAGTTGATAGGSMGGSHADPEVDAPSSATGGMGGSSSVSGADTAGAPGGPAGGMGDQASTGGTDTNVGTGSTAGAGMSDATGSSGSTGSTGMAASGSGSSSGSAQASMEPPTYNGQQLDSQQIRQVQQALSEQGQDLDADGIWGPNTKEALRSFQEAENIDATGELDEQTVSALGVDLESEVGMGGSASGSSSMGSTGAASEGMGEGATQVTPGEGSDPSEAQLVPDAEDDNAAPVRDLSTASGGN